MSKWAKYDVIKCYHTINSVSFFITKKNFSAGFIVLNWSDKECLVFCFNLGNIVWSFFSLILTYRPLQLMPTRFRCLPLQLWVCLLNWVKNSLRWDWKIWRWDWFRWNIFVHTLALKGDFFKSWKWYAVSKIEIF